jgi:hypothetical protein
LAVTPEHKRLAGFGAMAAMGIAAAALVGVGVRNLGTAPPAQPPEQVEASRKEEMRADRASREADAKAIREKDQAARARIEAERVARLQEAAKRWPQTKVEAERLCGEAAQLAAKRDWFAAKAKLDAADSILRGVMGTPVDDTPEWARLAEKHEKLFDKVAPEAEAATHEANIRKSVDVVADASALAARFASNSAAADLEFANKRILISGLAVSVSKNADGEYFLQLGNSTPMVRAFFVSDRDAARVKIGVTLRLICTSAASTAFTVDLGSCVTTAPAP